MTSLIPFAQAVVGTYEDTSVPAFQDEAKLVHVFLLKVNGVLTVLFEGTLDWQEWVFSDLLALEIPLIRHSKLGPVHAGFARDVLSVIDDIVQAVGTQPYYLCGHSKGASEAILCAALMKDLGKPPLGVFAFEPAKVGSAILRSYLADVPIIATSTYNANGPDVVTCVPPGPTWCHPVAPIAIKVSDSLSIIDKHKIPAVLAALEDNND